MQKPALSFAAMPGRRRSTIDLAVEIERRGFAGLYCPSFGDGLALSEALALVTNTIHFGTAIANIYTRHPYDFAQTAAFLHEVSAGRFRFGIGVSHGAMNEPLGIKAGKPLEDVRRFVQELRKGAARFGELPPVVLATLRRKMVELAAEIAEGAVWANASRSHMPASLEALGARRTSADFFVGNLIPTCVADDRGEAAEVMRRALSPYVQLPNYQNYWVEAGYEDEMHEIRSALGRGERDRLPRLMSDRWLKDVTLFGPANEVREGLEAWYEAGVRTPILVPSSTRGGQMKAFEEVLAVFAD